MSKTIGESNKELLKKVDDATHNISELNKVLPLIVPFARFGSHPEDILLELTFQKFIVLWDRFLHRLRLEGTMPYTIKAKQDITTIHCILTKNDVERGIRQIIREITFDNLVDALP